MSRDEAVEACHQLAKQCSDSGQLQSLLDHLFAVLNGSQGKLTVATHKISILQGAGLMSDNAVTGSSVQGLAEGAIAHFRSTLETEVHEKTLVQALEMMSKWGARLNKIPDTLIQWFHKGMALKTSTTAVRTAYIDCMSKCLHGNNITQGFAVLGLVKSSLERGGAGLAQLETLSAACLLLRLAATGESNDPVFANLRSSILDPDKHLFVNEKFLSAAAEDGLLKVLELCERIVIDSQSADKLVAVFRAILFCLAGPFAVVRAQARNVVKKMISMLGGTSIALALIHEFNNFIVNKPAIKPEDKSENAANEINSHILSDALVCLCSGTNLTEEDAHQIALASFFCSHHPAIFASSKQLWMKILTRLSINAKRLILLHKTRVIREAVTEFKPGTQAEAALATIVRIDPDIVIPKVVNVITQNLKNTAGCHVTRDEYFTYLTPSGELYDKSVIPGYVQFFIIFHLSFQTFTTCRYFV